MQASGGEPSPLFYPLLHTSDINLGLSYMQARQENSFGWPEIEKGLPYQVERIAALSAEGQLTVETLGATGRRFKADRDANVPPAKVAFENWTMTRASGTTPGIIGRLSSLKRGGSVSMSSRRTRDSK